jgi:hypothetical protein
MCDPSGWHTLPTVRGQGRSLGLRGCTGQSPLLRGATVSDELFHIRQPVTDSPFPDPDELRPDAEHPPFLKGRGPQVQKVTDLVGTE